MANARRRQRTNGGARIRRIADDERCMRRTNSAVNASAIDSATMKRFAAMHDCPLLIVRDVTRP